MSGSTSPGDGSGADRWRPSGAQLVALGILSSRLVGFLRDRLVAHLVGLSAAADVLTAALRGPNLLQTLLGDQALSAAFVPIYSRLLGKGRDSDARRFASAVLLFLGLASLALAVTGAVLAPWLFPVLFTGWAGRVDLSEPTIAAMRVLFPMCGVLVLSSWCLAVLTSHRRFLLPYVAPVAWNLVIVGALGWLSLRNETRPSAMVLVMTVAFAGLIGACAQLLVQLPSALRSIGGLALRGEGPVPGLGSSLRAFGPAVVGRGIVQVSGYLELWLASFLASGAVAALFSAQRVYLVAIGLLGTSVAVAELPELSRLTETTGGEFRERLGRAFVSMSFLTVPASVGLLATGFFVIGAILRTGQFGVAENWVVYLVLCAYVLGLVATTTSRLLQNVMFSRSDTSTPARVSAARLVAAGVSGGCLMLFMDRYGVGQFVASAAAAEQVSGASLRLGAAGLAFGSTIGAWLELMLLLHILGKEHGSGFLPWKRVVRFTGLALVAVGPVLGVGWGLREWSSLISGPVLVALFAAIYLGLARYLGFAEVDQLPFLRRRNKSPG